MLRLSQVKSVGRIDSFIECDPWSTIRSMTDSRSGGPTESPSRRSRQREPFLLISSDDSSPNPGFFKTLPRSGLLIVDVTKSSTSFHSLDPLVPHHDFSRKSTRSVVYTGFHFCINAICEYRQWVQLT